MKIVYMGTPEIAKVCLEKLYTEGFDIAAVYTKPDTPKNRGMKLIPSEVKAYAQSVGLPVYQPETFRDDAVVEELKALAPDLEIIAPWRIWGIKSRDEEIDYANARGIDVPVTKKRPYSMDRNLWHLSHEGHDLEDPWNAPQDDLYLICNTPEQAPNEAEYVDIEWEKGEPVAVNGEKLGPVELIEKLNALGAKHGVGIADMVENRLVGMKSRGVYETPGGAILYKAINVLETITLDKESSHFKAQLAQKYADIVYNGQWFTPLREALDAFADSLEKTVTGDVKLMLYKGNMINAGVTSPFTLYDEQTASFGVDKDYDQSDATGFINLFGLSIKERAKLSKNWPETK